MAVRADKKINKIKGKACRAVHGRDAADKLSLMQHADPFRLQYSA